MAFSRPRAAAMNASAPLSTELLPLYAEHLALMQRRADEALARGGFDHLLVPSGSLHYQVFDDRDYPYAVNPQFKAWLPLTRLPYSWLLYSPGQRPKVIYYQPFDYWHVVPDAPSGWWVDHFDIHIIRKPEDALALLPAATARCAILGEPQSALGAYVPNNPEPVIQYLEYQRSFKTAYEICLMREAQRLAVRGHRAAEAAFRQGQGEFAINMAYCAAVEQDANELPYGNIIALNEHGAVLHYMELDRQAPAASRSFLIDAGASFHGYASDITRSYAADAGSEFQARLRVACSHSHQEPALRSGLRKRRASQIDRITLSTKHFVFNTNAAIRTELIHPRPIDASAMTVLLHLIQQHIDEVQARLNRHHHPGLQYPRHPQIGMASRPLDTPAAITGGKTRHVMHLQADRMTQAMREECRTDPGSQGRFRRHRDHAEVLQHPHQLQVCIDV